jgi:hypothetical protein
MSPNLRLSLDVLCYSGMLVNKGTVKIADRQTGLRYMVHFAILAAEKAFVSTKLTDAISLVSLTDYREFSKSDARIASYLRQLHGLGDHCQACSVQIPPNAKFCPDCGEKLEVTSIIGPLLDEPVDALSLSHALRERVKPGFPKVGDVVQATREEIMRIKWIKEVRSRIIKNAADEFISG